MGYYTNGRGIKCFSPDDDENTMYLYSDSQNSLATILEMAKEKWPDADLNDLLIESQHIQTECIGYDLYDPFDWTQYIVIRRAAK